MFSGNKKNLFILVLLLVAFFSFVPDMTFAQEATLVGNSDHVTTPFDPIGTLVYRSLSTIGGLVAYLGGTLLNVSLSLFVFSLPSTVATFGLMDIVDYVWAFTRDIFNLLFIFGLTWIGFKFILGLDVNGAKRNLGTILIAALLINFSLFVTQLIIDVGNIAASEISELFDPAEDNPTQFELWGIPIIDVSTSFVAGTDITNIGSQTLSFSSYAATGEESDVGPGRELNVADALGMGLTIAILLILMGFVFAAGAFLMMARFFYLIFLMMFSPIMFLGFVLPKMQNISADWWRRLISQTIVGPAYLFMLLVSLRALDTLMAARGDGEMNTFGFIISSILVAGFVWASLVVAKKFGALGASASMNFVGNRFAGGAAGLLQGTVGRRFQKISESGQLKDATSKKGFGGWAARRTLNLSTKLGDTSFDARNVGGVGKRIGAGEGQKGGYATVTKQIADKEKAFADRVGTVDDDDERVSALQLEVEAAEQAMESKRRKIKAEQDEITQFERDKAAALTPAAKEGIQDKINIKKAEIDSYKAEVEKHKEDIDKRKENVQTEKFRRQIGTTPPTTAAALKAKRDNIKAKLVAYEAETIADQKNLKREEIATLKKELADAEKIAAQEAGGYAAYVEKEGDMNFFTGGVQRSIRNLLTGRDNDINTNAGKEIRKTYKDKVKGKDK